MLEVEGGLFRFEYRGSSCAGCDGLLVAIWLIDCCMLMEVAVATIPVLDSD
jgi:hypothetical protein